eukprot:GHVU01059898.1.p2 GENE.GHVU01059898.1~~GHVU01059898.1.p2  ORF type:complete len:175 (-),score=4.52 GHVU01059898.1:668-1192(-)
MHTHQSTPPCNNTTHGANRSGPRVNSTSSYRRAERHSCRRTPVATAVKVVVAATAATCGWLRSESICGMRPPHCVSVLYASVGLAIRLTACSAMRAGALRHSHLSGLGARLRRKEPVSAFRLGVAPLARGGKRGRRDRLALPTCGHRRDFAGAIEGSAAPMLHRGLLVLHVLYD